MRSVVMALLVLVVSASSAWAADGFYDVPLGPSGATGLRYRVNGTGTWQTANVVNGTAQVPGADATSLELDFQGVSHGLTTVDVSGYSIEEGSVTITVGGMTATGAGVSRTVTLSGSGGSSSGVQAFSQGFGSVFGPEIVADAVLEASQYLGRDVAAAVGVLLVWFLLRRGLAWAGQAFTASVSEAPAKSDSIDVDSLVSRHEMRNL